MTLTLKLGSLPPHAKQLEYIQSLGDGSGVSVSHFRAGRASGKTHALVLKVLLVATEVNPGLPLLVTEPTYRDCMDTFMRAWEQIVPGDLWTFSRADMRLRLVNGTEIDIRSRQIDNANKEPFRGPTYAAAFADELAKDRTNKAWQLMRATVRHPKAARKICDSTSTPRLGWYKQLLDRPDSHEIVATSWDNPYIDRAFVDGLQDEYSADFAAQELNAEWVAQSGRVWDNWSDEEWPRGNVHWAQWDPSLGYVLSLDLGVRSSWQIWQSHPAVDRNGRKVADGSIDVLVAEWTPSDGDAANVVRLISAEMGARPRAVFVGADVNTRSEVTGDTAAFILTQHWGPLLLQYPSGELAHKQLQYHVAKGRVCNSRGLRRVCVSAHPMLFPTRSPRWLGEVMRLDQWPDGADTFLDKDKRGGLGLEDSRDAFLYHMICRYQPSMTKMQEAAPMMYGVD